jgi:hypothetical protein
MPSSSSNPPIALALTLVRARGARAHRGRPRLRALGAGAFSPRSHGMLVSFTALLLSGRQQQDRQASCHRPLHILGLPAAGPGQWQRDCIYMQSLVTQ